MKPGPFKDQLSIMETGLFPITPHHSRMMLEDVMLLPVGQSVVLLISPRHHYFKKDVDRKTFLENMKAAVAMYPHQPWVISGETFIGVSGTVTANPNMDHLKSRSLTSSEINRLCSNSGGGGIVIKLKGTNYTKLIKFHEILRECEKIHIWSNISTKRISTVKKAMKDIKDTTRLGGIVQRYLLEVKGDQFQTSTFIAHYESLMKEADTKAKVVAKKEGDISSDKLTEFLSLDNSDPNFVAFKNHVDEVSKRCILGSYGEFSEFSSPILSQSDLSGFAAKFKELLPQYYWTVASLLNKKVSLY